jgi:hypothetical protein
VAEGVQPESDAVAGSCCGLELLLYTGDLVTYTHFGCMYPFISVVLTHSISWYRCYAGYGLLNFFCMRHQNQHRHVELERLPTWKTNRCSGSKRECLLLAFQLYLSFKLPLLVAFNPPLSFFTFELYIIMGGNLSKVLGEYLLLGVVGLPFISYRLTGRLFGNKEMRLLMLGLDAAGKTSESISSLLAFRAEHLA